MNELRLIIYKDFIIAPKAYYTENGVMYDITYSVYFKDGDFYSNYMHHTLKQVKDDLDFLESER